MRSWLFKFFGLTLPFLFPWAGRAAPALPAINTNNVVSIAAFGAVSSATFTNTTAIQDAINAAASGGVTNGLAGGTVEIPPGSYLSGPLVFKSKVNLQIDAGASLLMLPMADWPSATTPFILGSGLDDVEISGAGIINGQGSAWWGSSSRPNFIEFDKTYRIWIQNVTLENPPTFHLYLKNGDGNVTIQGININTDPTSPNTDGMDLGSTNILVRDCHISDGDDNIEIGGSGYTASDILITNCLFGSGHGVSMGSYVGAGVSNLLVVNCNFTNTDNGIRLKSDDGRGGVVQNLVYENLGMTNIKYAPIIIYSYYNSYGNPSASGITPSVAAGMPISPVSGTTPIWSNVEISNVTATASQPGIIWARTELPATNILLEQVNITSTDSKQGDGSFAIYNARAVQVRDCSFHVAGSSKNFELFNAGVVFTNSQAGAAAISLDGFAVTNALGFFSQPVTIDDAGFFGAGPLSLGASVVSDQTSLALSNSAPMQFNVGNSAAEISVSGNLAVSNVLNIGAADGFGAGTYTLFSYAGALTGIPSLGLLPAGYHFALDTSHAGKINLVVSSDTPPAPSNLVAVGTNLAVELSWNSVSGASGYNLYRSSGSAPYSILDTNLPQTNVTDLAVSDGVIYNYEVTALVDGLDSTNSLPVSATVLPSNRPVALGQALTGNNLALSWPADHVGWTLEIQTNSLGSGLGGAWLPWPGSTTTNLIFIPINTGNPSVFIRLVYP